MKTFILFFFAFTTVGVKVAAQPYMAVEVGGSTTSFMSNLHIGYEAAFSTNYHLVSEGEARVQLNTSQPAYFGAKTGIRFNASGNFSLSIMPGIYYRLLSTDHNIKLANGKYENRLISGVTFRGEFANGFFVEAVYLENPEIGVGMKFSLSRENY